MQYGFRLCFRTCHEARICDGDRERSSQHATKMCRWMRELILLIVSALYVDEDSKIVCPWCHFYACSRKFRAQLVKTASGDTLHRARNEKCGDWRMVGGLLGNVGDSYRLVFRVDMLCRGLFACPAKYWRRSIFDFPVALG